MCQTCHNDKIEGLLKEILETLKSMKQQEFDYWEAWKKAKSKEQNDEVVK